MLLLTSRIFKNELHGRVWMSVDMTIAGFGFGGVAKCGLCDSFEKSLGKK